MSGFGMGGEIFGALFAGAGIAIYITGAAMVGAAKLAFKAGKAAHDAYVHHEEARREALRKEIEAMHGAFGAEALSRHDTMVKAEKAAEESLEKAREDWALEAEAIEKEINEAGKKTEDIFDAYTKFLSNSVASAAATREKESKIFLDEITATAKKCMDKVSADAGKEYAACTAKMDKLATDLDKWAGGGADYCKNALVEGSTLFEILKAHYDCDAMAKGDCDAIKVLRLKLQKAVDDNDWRNGSFAASQFVQMVQCLQIKLEQEYSRFSHTKMQLQRAADELRAAIAASSELVDDATPDEAKKELKEYVDEECDADFWSEGRLSILWKEAKEMIPSLENFKFSDRTLGTARLLEATKLRDDIMQEFARARQHVCSRLALDSLLSHVDDGMEASGWETTGDLTYVTLNNATGHYDVTGDPRGDLRARYTNDRGDERTIILRNVYNPEEHRYEQRIVRFCNEAGTPDEMEREADDEAFNEAFIAGSGLPKSVGVHCDHTTDGMKSAG